MSRFPEHLLLDYPYQQDAANKFLRDMGQLTIAMLKA